MWLSQACNRGYVRMRKIFSGLRTITGWDHPFSASLDRELTRTDYTVHISPAGRAYLRHQRELHSTTTATHSISTLPIRKTNSG